MAEMNNVTMDTTSTVTKNKPNWAILIVTWALAVVFLVIGIVSLVDAGSTKLTLDTVCTVEDVEYGESYEFTYTPNASDTYYFYVRNSALSSITYGDGYTKAVNFVGYEGNYRVYKISLSADKKYTFNVPGSAYSSISAKITASFDDDDSSSSSSYWGW